MKRFDNKTLNKEIDAAINIAESLLLHNSKMMVDILSKDDFKYNSGLGIEVHGKIINCKKVAPVFLYKPFNIFSKAVGYSNGKEVYLNSRKLQYFKPEDVIGLLIHEYSHIAGMGHGNNYKTQEKCLYSVPYYLSENIGKWL
jgi:hypothetical protein